MRNCRYFPPWTRAPRHFELPISGFRAKNNGPIQTTSNTYLTNNHATALPDSTIRSEENPINFYADISHASEKEIDWRNTIEKDMGALHRHCNERMKAHHWCLANSSGYITFLGAWYSLPWAFVWCLLCLILWPKAWQNSDGTLPL